MTKNHTRETNRLPIPLLDHSKFENPFGQSLQSRLRKSPPQCRPQGSRFAFFRSWVWLTSSYQDCFGALGLMHGFGTGAAAGTGAGTGSGAGTAGGGDDGGASGAGTRGRSISTISASGLFGSGFG